MKTPTRRTLLLLAFATLTTAYALDEVKRVPNGFVGMRGKKEVTEAFEDVQKRAPPKGFHGMRGKKDESDYLQENEMPENRESIMGFHGMEGNNGELDLRNYIDLFEKRGPSLGFHGMRGKKYVDIELGDDYVDKRDYRMGFQGVRGKKDQDPNNPNGYIGGDHNILVIDDFQDNNLPQYIDLSDDDEEPSPLWDDEVDSFTKRAQKGFFGMRGKKVASGFFGVRGKKGPSNAFFGVRGKKVPSSQFFGVRGKKAQMGFQGVRGKKDGKENLDSLLYNLNTKEEDARDKRYSNRIKNVPSGFLGMRGKKDWDAIIRQGPSAEQTANVDGIHELPPPASQ